MVCTVRPVTGRLLPKLCTAVGLMLAECKVFSTSGVEVDDFLSCVLVEEVLGLNDPSVRELFLVELAIGCHLFAFLMIIHAVKTLLFLILLMW